jgi:ribose/xylose/arabinose/galactoside ABC-type transport system permease subunit
MGLCIAAYMASAIIAAVVGFYYNIRISVATPTTGSGLEAFILFAFACVISSRALDNRFAPVVYALLPALSWAVMRNALILNRVVIPTQNIFDWILVAIALLIAFFSRYEKNRAPAASRHDLNTDG